jgi:cysteinyl-tRNA synthetase
MLRIYNTLGRIKQEFSPLRAGEVRMYVCGITVYDYCHLGHARMFIVFDVVQRWLRASGYRVTYVRNITDIDDKIIRRAAENHETVGALTERFIRYMDEDAAALGVEKPDHEPRATQYVAPMLEMIDRLERRRLAYQSASGDVNYAVRRFPGYGKLSGKSLDELRAGERVDVDQTKEDPLDFVLWKRSKPDEPSWASRWGAGRPGWHIECSAMACKLLGAQFDIHGGGQDLQFPHHENEIAQSEGAMEPNARGQFVRYWMHNGFVRKDDEKMSKSLGNFSTIRDVLKSYDAEVVRFFILRAHYRSALNYSDAHLDDAKQALSRLYTALKGADEESIPVDWTTPHARRFKDAMDDDFGTPEAVAVLFELAHEIGRGRKELASQLRALGGVLGILQNHPERFFKTTQVKRHEVHLSDEGVADLIKERTTAKERKDFKTADRIRDELGLFGVLLEDTKGASEWKRASGYRLIELDELEDFRFEATRHGYRVEDFRIKERPDPTPSSGVHPAGGEIEITYIPTNKSVKLRAGHGTSWVVEVSDLAGKKYFG